MNLGSEASFGLMRAMAMALHHNSDLREAFREQRVAAETGTIRRLLERATERGEIRLDDPALPYAIHMMLRPAMGSRAFAQPGLVGSAR